MPKKQFEEPTITKQLRVAEQHFNNLMQLYSTILDLMDNNNDCIECTDLLNLIEKQQDTIRKLTLYNSLS